MVDDCGIGRGMLGRLAEPRRYEGFALAKYEYARGLPWLPMRRGLKETRQSTAALTLCNVHRHFAVLVHFLSDGGDDGHTPLLRLDTRGGAIVRLLHELVERLELVRVAVDILDGDASFLAAREVVSTKWNVLARRPTTSAQGRLARCPWHGRCWERFGTWEQ